MTFRTGRLPAFTLAFAIVGCAPSPVTEDTTASSAPRAEPDPHRTAVSGIAFPVVSRHEGVFNGQRVRYTAMVDQLAVADGDGAPGANIVSTAYVAEATAAEGRPVVFYWNGGPISPSVYLHMGFAGPKRVAFSEDLSKDVAAAAVVDNPHALLDVADLVFFDPAGTGFSRAVPGKPLDDYFSIVADAQQTAAFIAGWLDAHDRRGDPVYLFGESYGTNRAVETAGQLAALAEPVLVDGVVLFGQAVNIIEYAQRPMNIISYVVSLPTLAAIGWHHGLAGQDQELAPFVESAWDFAGTQYLQALFQGNALPAERLQPLSERLEALTGLDAEVFVASRLRVSKEQYRRALFRDEGLIIGRADGRYVGPAQVEGAAAGTPPPDPSGGLPARLAEAYLDYLVDNLGVPSAEQYLLGSPVRGLAAWEWKGQSPFSHYAYGDALDALLESHPGARVLVSAGYQDTMTTAGASRYLARQARWPREQVDVVFYPGGHMAYSIESSARAMADDLRALVTRR